MFAAAALVLTVVFAINAQPAAAMPGISFLFAPAPPASAPFGKTVTFSGTIDNTGTTAGTDDFSSVTLADAGSTGLTIMPAVVPAGTITTTAPAATFTTADAPKPFSVTAQVNAAPGGTAQLRLTATGVTAAGNQVVNINADVAVTEAVVLEVTAERRDGPTATLFPCPDATCAVSIQDGLKFTVKVRNLSDVAAALVAVQGDIPPNTADVPGSSTFPLLPIPLPLPVLAPNSDQLFVREVSVDDSVLPGAVITFSATASYSTLLPLLGPRPAGGSPAGFTADVADPLLTISNALTDSNGGQLLSGDSVLSTIRIDNTGNADATNTIVTATLTNLANPFEVRIGGALATGNRFDVTANTVTVRVGAPPITSTTGGTFTPADPVIEVTFLANVVASPVGAPAQAQSTASVSFNNGGVSPKTATAAPLAILPPPNVSVVINPTPVAPGPVARGSLISYQVVASAASGAANATDVTLSFSIPPQTTFQSASASAGGTLPTGGPGGPITSFFAGTSLVAGGPSIALTVVVMVSPTATETAGASDIVAKAKATFGPGVFTVNATDVGHELRVAQLTVTNDLVDDNGGELIVGEGVESDLTVDNTGTADATGVVVTVALTNVTATPGSVRINGLVPNPLQVTLTPSQVVVRIGTGAGAAGGTITPADPVIAISFKGVVAASPSGSPPQAVSAASVAFGNGGASPALAADQIAIKAKPGVSVVVTTTPAAPGPVPRDTNITYTVTASNAANVAAATDVDVSFNVPAQTAFVSATAVGGTPPAPSALGGVVTTRFPTIAAGDSATLAVVVHLSATPTKTPGAAPPNDATPANDIVAGARAVYGPGSNPQANATPVALEISAADLTLAISPTTQSIQKQKPADVTVTVGNLGPDPATGTKTVTITADNGGTIPTAPGCTGVSTNQVTCVIAGPLAVGAAGNVTFPIKVVNANPLPVVVTASLAPPTLPRTAPEIDENGANNANVTSTVSFQQSESNLSITASPPAAALVVDGPGAPGPVQNVTYTLSVADLNVAPNQGDPAEGVVVNIPIPAQVRATTAAFAGAQNGTCTVPAGSGGAVACTIGSINDGGTVTVVVELRGTALLGVATPITATATLANNDLTQPNTASVSVTVVPQPVDLSVSNSANATFQSTGPAVLTASGSFTATVTNNPLAPTAFPVGDYTLTVGTGAAGVALTPGDPACVVALNVVTCNATGLAPGASRSFVVNAAISVPGPVMVQSTVTLRDARQTDPAASAANNTATWTVIRNLPPDAVADVGPTIPDGATLVFDVLNNDTDGDATDIPNLVVLPPFTGGGNLTITLEGKKIRAVVPAAEPAATLTVAYSVVDGRGGSTPTTLKIRVVGPVTRSVEGSFGRPPPGTPNSFGLPIAPDRTGDTPTNIDVLEGPLGLDANGSAFPATLSYDLESVSADSLNVKGSAVSKEDGTTKKVARYVPARGYTSDPASAPNPNAIVKAPPDSFTYRTTGTKGTVPIFTVDALVTAEVKNQSPIGVDDDVPVRNGLTRNSSPSLNDLDGNTVKDAIPVKSPAGSFTFDDEGEITEARGLTITCIGPVPELDATTKLPTQTPADVCAPGNLNAAFRPAGQELVLETPTSKGKVTVTLAATTTPETQAFRTITATADATVVGELPFVYVVVDNYGGTGFGRATVRVPNTPPLVIDGVRTVLKNTPTLVVDTRLAAQDANGDPIVVSSVPAKTEKGGTVVIGDSNRTITYTPPKDYLGPDKFTYTVSDGRADGTAEAELNLNVVEQPSVLSQAPGGTPAGGAAAGGAAPKGSLAATGGDPLALTGAAGFAMVLGLALVQAGRRRRSRPLLDQARHLRT